MMVIEAPRESYLLRDYSLARHSWFNAGGKAEMFYEATSVAGLQDVLSQLAKDTALTAIGGGSNILVRDGGIAGLTVLLAAKFAKIESLGANDSADGELIYASAGVNCANLANAAQKRGLSGLEFMIGIPGAVGGAVAMNAGAYDKETSDCLFEVDLLNRDGRAFTLGRADMAMGYRQGNLPKDSVVVGARFFASRGDAAQVRATMDSYRSKRKATQPIQRGTGGSTFKNPSAAVRAWQLIEQSGANKLTCGRVKVSDKHANFLINEGDCAADIETLGEMIRAKVLQETGLELEWEIRRLGVNADQAGSLR